MDTLSLIISIISCFIVYSLFDKTGFKAGLIFKLLLQLAVYFINGSLVHLYNSGISYLIIMLTIVFIINLITTTIEYFIYNNTNSFVSYVIFASIVESLILFALSLATDSFLF